tara:strand:+ start:70 stop:834 length:765 start_codon:yes stop_codon:yes gene_type:complete
MFLDSDNNTGFISGFADENFTNHMGVLWTTASHREGHRYDDVYADYKKKAPASSGDSCAELKTALDIMKSKVSNANAMSTSSSGKRRVRDRHIKAAKAWRDKIQGWYNAGQCDAILTTVTPGCTNQSATNFNPNADQDDGSCIFPSAVVYGCTDSGADNYNSNATNDDGSCQYPPPVTTIYGCMDSSANNYNRKATQEDGSCIFPAPTNIFGTTTTITEEEIDGDEELKSEDMTMWYVIGGVLALTLGYIVLKK